VLNCRDCAAGVTRLDMLGLIEKGFLTLEALGSLLEDRLSLAVWIWDFETGEMRWSKGVYALFGHPANSVKPSFLAMEQFVHPNDRKPRGEIERALREGIAMDREQRTIAPEGRIRWIRSQIAPVMNAEGFPVRAIGLCTDVTSYHDKLHFYRLSGNRFNAICSIEQALIWTATPDGSSIELLNHAALGTSLVDVRALMHPDDRVKFDARVAERRQTRKLLRTTFRLRFPADDYNTFSTRVIPIANEQGEIYEWIGISVDLKITEQTFMTKERQLTGAQIRAARAMLRWSVAELASAAHVSPSVIRRLEEIDGASAPEPAHHEIDRTVTQAGVEFIFPREGKPGVRPR